jgi:hypothetical protein
MNIDRINRRVENRFHMDRTCMAAHRREHRS